MNFVDSTANKLENGKVEVEVDFAGVKTMFTPKKSITLKAKDIIIGIRPEYIKVVPDSKIKGKVYSTLPAGMETTIKFKVGELIITSVVFGIIDFALDSEMSLDFLSEDICLFDKSSGENLGLGKLLISTKK